MNQPLKRKDFIRQAAVFSAALVAMPKFLLAKNRTFFVNTFKMDAHAIIDLHCHPSLKMYMLDKSFWHRHLLRSAGANMIHMQEDTYEFNFGYVRGMLATHYLPEKGIEKEWGTVKFLWPLIRKIAFRTADKIEHGDYSNFGQINQMMDVLESQIHVVNDKLQEAGSILRFTIVRGPDEFMEALSTPEHPTNTIPIAHSIEGAHALGSNFLHSGKKLEEQQKKNLPPGPNEGKMISPVHKDEAYFYKLNLESLHLRGVCLVTLSHFFSNDISFPVEGISPKQKKTPGMKWCYDPERDNRELTSIGREVVKHMFDIGVIVDLTHSTPAVRDDVYRLNRERQAAGKPMRPVIFTHTGSKEVFDRHNGSKNVNYDSYGVRTEDIIAICECDGVIGIIPEIFWLAGANDNPEIDGVRPPDIKNGIPYMIETIKSINAQTPQKDFRHLAVGTDFDGLAENPKDLYLNEQLGGFFDQMKNDHELKINDHIELITYKNTLRVLQAGWDKPKLV